MHPLDGPRLKVSRAKAEIDRLRLMQDAFFVNTHYEVIRAEQNPESGKNVWRLRIDGPPPSLDWGIYIGEIAHNLRSALNHLVYQLALLNSANEPETLARNKRFAFPIFVDEGDFKSKKGNDMIKLLKPVHQTSIKLLQPYNGSSSPCLKTVDLSKRSGRDSPLFWLEEINNADKHRMIQVAGVRTSSISYTFWGERPDPFTTSGFFSILEDGAKMGESAPDVDVHPQIRPLIAFASGCDAVAKKPVCLLLDLAATTVSEIIDRFSPEFPH